MTTPHLAGHPAASQKAIVDAALLMLQQMGLSPGDLVTTPRDRPPVPTFGEYVPVVSAAVTAEGGVMIARRDPGGVSTVPSRPYVVIPAALRRRCGLRAGDHVLLAASPGEDVLAAYSFAVVDQAMRAHASVPGEGRRP